MAEETDKKKAIAKVAKKDKEVIVMEEIKEVEEFKELTQRIYVGPNLLELQKYTVVEEKFTPHIEGLIKKCPAVGKLFVKIEEMAYVESRVKEKGTLEHRHYNNVIAYGSGKGEE